MTKASLKCLSYNRKCHFLIKLARPQRYERSKSLASFSFPASFSRSLLWRPIATTKMADVYVESYGHLGSKVLSGKPSPLPRPYLPSLPPAKTTKPSYSR